MFRWLALVFLLLVTPACGLLTRPSDRITVERQQFLNAYARASVLYANVAERMTRFCAAGTIDRQECARMAAVHEQAKALDAEIRAKLAVPESEVDWARIMRLLELALELAL